jgi:acyl-CoA hydrolase
MSHTGNGNGGGIFPLNLHIGEMQDCLTLKNIYIMYIISKEQALALLQKENEIKISFEMVAKQNAKVARLAEVKAAKAATKACIAGTYSQLGNFKPAK